jgi:hypothetical protein
VARRDLCKINELECALVAFIYHALGADGAIAVMSDNGYEFFIRETKVFCFIRW